MSPPEIFVTIRELQELVPLLTLTTVCFSIVGVFCVLGFARFLVALFDWVSFARRRHLRESQFSSRVNDTDIPY